MNDDGRAAALRQGALRSFGRFPKPLRRLITRAESQLDGWCRCAH